MLTHGFFPLRGGFMMGFEGQPESQGVLLSWGMWELHDAANEDKMNEPPTAA